jgi:ergothioneine biosynthesis protein EgtB
VKTDQVREPLLRAFASARLETDRLFEMLAPQAISMRTIPERHRLIFYVGHLEAFDWNMIGAWAFGIPSFNSEFDRLFAFGIDPVDGKLPQDTPADWPRIDQVISYRDRIRNTVDGLLERADFTDESKSQIVHVAIEHRLMHAETLAYMLHWLDFDLKRRGAPPNSELQEFGGAPHSPVPRSPVPIPAGYAGLGRTKAEGFGWDNEFDAQSVFVPEFSIDAFNVTNRDFIEFVNCGGYQNRSFWTAEGWSWLQETGISHPKFWIRKAGDSWFYRTMFEEIPMPPDWPVIVSHAEAAAYAAWKGRALPSEEQYHRAAFGSESGAIVADGNFDSRSWSPTPVGSFAPNAFGVFDLVGNGWEWTSTLFAPFDGFRPFTFYPGYSADFFDGKHFVMKGASPRTARPLVRTSFRNWFQPYYPNVYATFRCVTN